jgi:hypothetical protein
MIAEFLRQRFEPNYPTDRIELAMRVFDTCIDFLRDPNQFPNNEVNRVFQYVLDTLDEGIIGPGKVILVTIPKDSEIPSVNFIVNEQYDRDELLKFLSSKGVYLFDGLELNQTVKLGNVQIPSNLPELFNKDPLRVLTGIAHIGSQVLDFRIVDQLTIGNIDVIINRAKTMGAEVLNTVRKMAEKEGVDLGGSSVYQKMLLRDFPEGIKSLPLEMREGLDLTDPRLN